MEYGVSDWFAEVCTKWMVLLLIVVGCNDSWAQSYNVYVAIQNSALQAELQSWYRAFEAKVDRAQYPFRPFLSQFPLHVSLYLSEYDRSHLANMKLEVRRIARHQQAFCMYTGDVYLTTGNWLMLGLEQHPRNGDALQRLHHLSDRLVVSLSPLRDKQATIPVWARHYPDKVKAFQHYGSPNVFFEFDPHMSLFGPPAIDPPSQRSLQQKVTDFIARHRVAHRCVRVDAIAIGEVNSDGQIIREIATYPLTGNESL